ncbi:porin family protein [Hymenobacter cavernae]|nr:porin family protein [Hymenobacter cavernae]
MKTFLVSVLLMVSLALPGQAQRLRLGLKAGANLGNGVGKDVQQSKLRFAYHGGLTANISLGLLGDSVLSFQPEVLYSIKGDQATATDSSINSSLTYIDVPLLLKANIAGLFFEAGPQISFYRSSGPVTFIDPATTTTVSKTGYGVAVGFGYQDPGGFNVGWRYTRGLSAIEKSIPNPTGQGSTTLRIYNSTLQFYVGYLFGGKKSKPRAPEKEPASEAKSPAPK